jgi:UDP-2,3-diacylglucosamine pyrophosphatase LpxH
LGSDLVQHARPDAPERGLASLRRDRELVALLAWYRERPQGKKPWRLVIAGDFIDFAGMSVSGLPDEIATEPTDEERRHGLGSAADHTLIKLRRVASHHRDVFAALAEFVAAGNCLVVVRGNHDVDLHWECVQAEFRDLLGSHAIGAGEHVEFADWFYYEEGVAYIEHGHQYDDYCSYDHVLHPVLPSDPRRSYPSVSDVLLRYVVRPTRGMLESGHDSAGALDYLRFGARLGLWGLLDLGRRFVLAVVCLIGIWREHFSDAATWVRQEHERKMALLAEARQISLIKLRALAKLQRPPVTRSLTRLLAGVMLDRVAVALASVVALTWLLVARWTLVLGASVGLCLAGLALTAWLWGRARATLDASDSLRERAGAVAGLFPAALVVMGHTHMPEMSRRKQSGATYVNLGAWAEEDTPDGTSPPLPASRTHLVVCQKGKRLTAKLLRWDAAHGTEVLKATRLRRRSADVPAGADCLPASVARLLNMPEIA